MPCQNSNHVYFRFFEIGNPWDYTGKKDPIGWPSSTCLAIWCFFSRYHSQGSSILSKFPYLSSFNWQSCGSSCRDQTHPKNIPRFEWHDKLAKKLEAEGKGTKASEGKCGNVKRGVVVTGLFLWSIAKPVQTFCTKPWAIGTKSNLGTTKCTCLSRSGLWDVDYVDG